MTSLAVPFMVENYKLDKLKERYGKNFTIEYNIQYNYIHNSLEKLVHFLEECPNKINLSFTNFPDEKTLDEVLNVFSSFPNLSIRCTQVVSTKETSKFQEKKIPFFLDSLFPAYNYKSLHSILQLGVSEIYLADDLWHDTIRVKHLCEEYGVKVRAILNKVPITIGDKNDITNPIFFPSDFPILKKYCIDTVEFDCGNQNNGLQFDWSKFSALVRTWFNDPPFWLGSISEINDDISIDINAANWISEIGRKRWQCQSACLATPNSCHWCDSMCRMSENAHRKGIILNQGKKE